MSELVSASEHPSPKSIKAVVKSMRHLKVGRGGTKLAGALIEAAERIKPRTKAQLLGGQDPEAAAERLVREAAHKTMVIGAASGALSSATELSPPAWVTLPLGPMSTTILTALVEVKLIIELKTVFDQPSNATDALKTWALGRAGRKSAALSSGTALSRMLGQRLMRRLVRSATGLSPLLIGAGLGGMLARQGTMLLGGQIVEDLSNRTELEN